MISGPKWFDLISSFLSQLQLSSIYCTDKQSLEIFVTVIKMADSVLIQYGSTTVTDLDPSLVPVFVIGHYCHIALCLVTFIYGVTSWYLIRKFRNFNNYVYLSAILVNILRLTVLSLTLIHCENNITDFRQCLGFYGRAAFIYLTTVYNYWLIVMCYMFYVDIVKVFDKNIGKKYLKSSLFAWAVPLLILIICGFILVIIEIVQKGHDEVMFLLFVTICTYITSNLLPSVFNLTLFIKVVYSLYFSKDTETSVVFKQDKTRRLSVATAMFILSNVFMFTFILWDVFDLSIFVRGVTLSIQMIALAFFVPLVKSNRRLWYEFYKNRSSRRG